MKTVSRLPIQCLLCDQGAGMASDFLNESKHHDTSP